MHPHDVITDPQVITRLAEDHAARRELIWLDAAARGDRDQLSELEAVDPQVTARLAPFIEDYRRIARPAPLPARLYADVWVERFCHLAAALDRETCRCVVCVTAISASLRDERSAREGSAR